MIEKARQTDCALVKKTVTKRRSPCLLWKKPGQLCGLKDRILLERATFIIQQGESEMKAEKKLFIVLEFCQGGELFNLLFKAKNFNEEV